MNEKTKNMTQDTVKTVQENSDIEISFKLSLLDGTVVDQTEDGEVFAFQIGDGQLLNRLDELLIGLEVGTTGKFTLMPEQAFGLPDPENFKTMSRSDFPDTMVLEEGYVIGFDTPSGDEIPGTIYEVSGDDVVVDFNHPLTGQVVVFEAKIENILS
jgi:FKBP-type peptidyl-prolyl cis-trans isomerase SlpA